MTQNYPLPFTVTPPTFSGFNKFYYNTQAQLNTRSDITTYGALILPFNLEEIEEDTKIQTNPKQVTKQAGKIKTAIKNSKIGQVLGTLGAEIKQNNNVKILSAYMQDKRDLTKLGTAFGIIGSKFSGIAVTQALMDGKVSSKEALDYLFMGFAPALGVQGSLMGYSGLNQMKEALFDGSINVGAFVSGFRRTLKGGKDLADMLTAKQQQVGGDILEFDLTISHSENYQSESPDRRVQSGQSLQEFVHNLPETFEVQCALQEGKRYSKAEFRAIMQYLRERKETVQLVLGDELFDSLILANFAPTHDCTKSGMDYTLSFKKITRSNVIFDKEVIVQTKPKLLEDDSAKITSYGSMSGGGSNASLNIDMNKINQKTNQLLGGIVDNAKQVTSQTNKKASLAVNLEKALKGLFNDKDN